MARKRGPHIVWRDRDGTYYERYAEGRRAYGEFRTYEDVGGGREALAPKGKSWATTDLEEADRLFSERLNELQNERQGRTRKIKNVGLLELARVHLEKKARANQTTDRHLVDLEQRLRVAVDYFGGDVDPKDITTDDVRAWWERLAETPSHKGGTLAPVTIRNYLWALSGLYGRAQEMGYVQPDYNPVKMLQEMPQTSNKSETRWFEVPEAALILEAARKLDAEGHGNMTPAIHAIVATLLLTGGRLSAVLGLEVEDIAFDTGKVRFRPNAHRRLKTKPSHRDVPLWPQLRSILQAHLFGGDSPRTTGLVFPSRDGSMITNINKALDAIGGMCGMEPKTVRATPLRHTYASARLQTVQRIIPPGAHLTDGETPYEWVEVSRFTVAKEMGHGGTSLVDSVYGHAGDNPHRSEVVEYDAGKMVRQWTAFADNAEAAADKARAKGEADRAGELAAEADRWREKADTYRRRLREIVGPERVAELAAGAAPKSRFPHSPQ